MCGDSGRATRALVSAIGAPVLLEPCGRGWFLKKTPVPPIRSSYSACRKLVQELRIESGTGTIYLPVPPLLAKFVAQGAAMYHNLRKRHRVTAIARQTNPQAQHASPATKHGPRKH